MIRRNGTGERTTNSNKNSDINDDNDDDDDDDRLVYHAGELTPLTGNRTIDQRYPKHHHHHQHQQQQQQLPHHKNGPLRSDNNDSIIEPSSLPLRDDKYATLRTAHHKSGNSSNNTSKDSVVYLPVNDEEEQEGSSATPSSLTSRKRTTSLKQRTKCIFAVSTAVVALVLCVLVIALFAVHGLWEAITQHLQHQSDNGSSDDAQNGSSSSSRRPLPYLNEDDLFDEVGRYITRDYDSQRTFADFLPGLAGIYGKPLWAFFVNRGQAIASFGVESKETPIMEYVPANKAFQTTPLVGFRTFVQGQRGNERPFVVEPFSPLTTNYRSSINNNNDNRRDDDDSYASPTFDSRIHNNQRNLYSGENEMQIQELDLDHELETNVTYFVLPEEDFGAFVRRTTITNLHTRQDVTISFLDGLAKMQPAGGDLDVMLKTIGRTLEGFMGVYFPNDVHITMPFYRLSTRPSDSDLIQVQERGNYCMSIKEGHAKDGEEGLLPIVYDTSKVFGEDTTLLRPLHLLQGKSVSAVVHGPQYGKAKTSSCFAAVEDVTLAPGESITISTFFGATNHIMDVPVYARRIRQEGFVQYKLARTREVIRQITKSVETKTRSMVFDAHVSQMFLDNSLRGGIPIVLGDQDDNNGLLTMDEDPRLKVIHVFSRIHGDLERDYNAFLLRSTFFSQGPGKFRDVAQNRRNDVVFQPRMGSFNIRMFLSFIQADGYEPHSVEAVVFTIDSKTVCDRIATVAVGPADGHRAQREALSSILSNGPFRPGQLFRLMAEQNIFLMVSRQDFIDMVAVASTSTPMAVYEIGNWADHWTYFLDMVESYISIFPDEEERVMFGITLPYFFSPAFVQPRRKKYVENLAYSGSHEHIQQLDATVLDEAKKEYMDKFVLQSTNWYSLTANWQHDESGTIMESSVYAKLFLLVTLKFSTRDAYGMGIEYEGGRPGWDDANNGIPGMLGSGMPETFELKALIQYLIRVAREYGREFCVPEELHDLVESINGNLTILADYEEKSHPTKNVHPAFFTYWDSVSTAREAYRERVKLTFSGKTRTISAAAVVESLRVWLVEIDRGIARAMSIGTKNDKNDENGGVIPTYFAYRVTKWNHTGEINANGHKLVEPLSMSVREFALFLEGPTRMLKTVDAMEARNIYLQVRNSTLYDEDLKMFTISSSLAEEPFSIGRSMAFAPGWLENQSVWLHMSYKFYLELLRQGLYGDFFNEVQMGGLLPFMDAKRYGRSPMECSSFIVSSAFEDPEERGRGFLGRLSGSTAEFLSMWIIMFIGPKPFYRNVTTGEVQMQLVPTLPAWLFGKDGELPGEVELRAAGIEKSMLSKVSFKLFSSISVHYYNKKTRDLIGTPPVMYRVGLRDGSVFQFDQAYLPGDMADKIRRVVLVDYIEAHF